MSTSILATLIGVLATLAVVNRRLLANVPSPIWVAAAIGGLTGGLIAWVCGAGLAWIGVWTTSAGVGIGMGLLLLGLACWRA